MDIQPTPATLKLSIWRHVAPKRALALQDGEDSETRPIAPDSKLHEEVYAWNLHENPFLGIRDDVRRRKFREEFLDHMNPALAPSKRPLSLLDKFAEKALKIVESGAVDPSGIQGPPAGGDDDAIEMNTLLAFALHLKWLSHCLADRPGISVSAR